MSSSAFGVGSRWAREEAERYLRDTTMPMGQLVGLLGYSEQSIFTRACQRWFGTTGSAQRRESLRQLQS